MIKFLNAHDIYNEAILDFSTARPFLDDHVRFGNKYVFGKHSYTILRYTDISKVYQFINMFAKLTSLNAIENYRLLIIQEKFGLYAGLKFTGNFYLKEMRC